MERSDKGESSRKNECVDEEKPLKKARYVWEVKGKQHLKHSTNNFIDSATKAETQICHNTEGEQKRGPIIQPASPSRNCCIKTFLAKTEDIMDRDSSDEDDSQKLPLESSIENEIPVTLVSVQPKNQDFYLRKWQARQIARGFVDNTLNSMLENWDDRPVNIDNFTEDLYNDDQVEDDAILMAIQSHGLRSGWRGAISSSSSSSSGFSAPSSSSNSSDFDLVNEPIYRKCDNYENLQKEHENASVTVNPLDEEFSDPLDLINEAVSAAIQKKGLTYG